MDETAEALKHSKHSLVPCAPKHGTNGKAENILKMLHVFASLPPVAAPHYY